MEYLIVNWVMKLLPSDLREDGKTPAFLGLELVFWVVNVHLFIF